MLITSLSIITSISAMILSYIIIRFVSKLVGQTIDINVKNIMLIVFQAVSSLIIHNITDTVVSIVLYFLTVAIVSKMVLKISISKAALSSMICYLMLICADILSLFVYILLKNDPFKISLDEKMLIGNIMVSIIMYTIPYIKPIKNGLSYIISKSERKVFKVIMTSTIIIAVVYTFIYYNISIKSIETILVNSLTIILFTTILIKFYLEKISKDNIKNEFEKMNEYVKIYEEIIEKDRITRHENKNQLITIKGMISKKDKKTNEYIDSLISDNNDMSNKWVSELKYIPIGGLKGLLFYKVNKMRSSGIEVDLTISRSLEGSKLQDIDTKLYKQLCQIIGVYVDNAIEACMEADIKNIGIEIYKDGDIFEFIISNTYKGTLNMDSIDSAGYTTKGDGHGYGLSLVKDIINSNSKFFQNREMINDYYIQHLFLDLTE